MSPVNLLSIVIITLDDVPSLSATLRSIQNSFYHSSFSIEDISIIIINKTENPQNALLLLQDFPILLPSINHYTQTSSGIFEAFNESLDYTSSQWIQFLNSGDQLVPENFKKLLSILPTVNNDALIFQAHIMYKEFSIGYKPAHLRYPLLFPLLSFILQDLFWPCHQAIIFNSKFQLNYEYPVGQIGGDSFLISRLIRRNNIVLIPLPAVIHFADGVSSSIELSSQKYSKQILHSLRTMQLRRVLALCIKFIFSRLGVLIRKQLNIDVIRLISYNICFQHY